MAKEKWSKWRWAANIIVFGTLAVFIFIFGISYAMFGPPEPLFKARLSMSSAAVAELKKCSYEMIGKSPEELMALDKAIWERMATQAKVLHIRGPYFAFDSKQKTAVVCFHDEHSNPMSGHFGIAIGSLRDVDRNLNCGEMRWLSSRWDNDTWFFDEARPASDATYRSWQ